MLEEKQFRVLVVTVWASVWAKGVTRPYFM